MSNENFTKIANEIITILRNVYDKLGELQIKHELAKQRELANKK